MPESSYFEVRCERCKTSFAPGTKRCIHCGEVIGRRLLAFDAFAGGRTGPPSASEPAPGAPDAQPTLGRLFRIAMIALVAATAVARACIESR